MVHTRQWLLAVLSCGLLACGPSSTQQPVGGKFHADFSAISNANTRGDAFDADAVLGEILDLGGGMMLTNLNGTQNYHEASYTGSRVVMMTLTQAPVQGKVYTIGMGPGLVTFEDDTSYPPGGHRAWDSKSGTITIDSVAGTAISFTIEGAKMEPAGTNGDGSAGTFTLSAKASFEQVRTHQ